jgi:hypothetical protein
VAKAQRKQKLKVYRTPIGFHDAFVAAPSQKAALEAWGTDTNLFAQGSAELVSDPALMKLPLENPGEVVKVLRGTQAEQLAALAKAPPPKRKAAAEAEIVPPKAKKKRPPVPSRSSLAAAEAQLEKLEKRQSAESDRMEKRLKQLQEEIRDLGRKHERARHEAEEKVEKERERYNAAIARYEAG